MKSILATLIKYLLVGAHWQPSATHVHYLLSVIPRALNLLSEQQSDAFIVVNSSFLKIYNDYVGALKTFYGFAFAIQFRRDTWILLGSHSISLGLCKVSKKDTLMIHSGAFFFILI